MADSSDDDEESDVFYSCDSDTINSSPTKPTPLSNIASPPPPPPSLSPTEKEEAHELPLGDDPISTNIRRKLSMTPSMLQRPVLGEPKVRFAESTQTYEVPEGGGGKEVVEEEEEEEELDSEVEQKSRVSKVFTKIKTRAEVMHRSVASTFDILKKEKEKEKEKEKDSDPKNQASATKWFKDLIGPTARPTPLPYKNSVTSFIKRKNKQEFGCLVCVQTIEVHDGAVWSMKFSPDGNMMASGGHDGLLRVWKVNTTKLWTGQPEFDFFQRTPFQEFEGHNGDILDLCWSKNNKQLLSASMDRTVRLWQMDEGECVHAFQHTDIVTCATFHPMDDNLFLSGSLDGKLILWNIEQRSAIHAIDTHEFITTSAFTLDGKMAIAGSHSGLCSFYATDGLAPSGKIYVHSSRGKNKKGKKISGIDVLPDGKNILVTSNDSRIRLYKLSDFSCECKYKGLVNNSFQIKATSNSNGNYIICGSEDNMVYIWNTRNDFTMTSATDNIPLIGAGARDDVNISYECFATQSEVVTVALFSPHTPPEDAYPHLPTAPPSLNSSPRGSVELPDPFLSQSTPLPPANSKKDKGLPIPYLTMNFDTYPPASQRKSNAPSISSFINMITPTSSKKAPSSPSSTSPQETTNQLSVSPQLSSLHTHPSGPMTQKRGSKVFTGGLFGAEQPLVSEEQLVYMVTADACGQIRVFENLPPSHAPIASSV